MQPVVDKLEMLEILPVLDGDREQASEVNGLLLLPANASQDSVASETETSESEEETPQNLAQRVIRRAEELRQQWQAA